MSNDSTENDVVVPEGYYVNNKGYLAKKTNPVLPLMTLAVLLLWAVSAYKVAVLLLWAVSAYKDRRRW